MLSFQELESLLKTAFPDAVLKIKDLVGDQNHYHVTVLSNCFKGLTLVQQHQKVYQALQGKVGYELHALSITTGINAVPEINGDDD